MKLTSLIFIGALCLCSLTGHSQTTIQLNKKVRQALEQVDSNAIKKDVAFLADDKLKGRMPGKAGYQTAVDYVVEHFQKIGLNPAGDLDGYTQKLILRKATVDMKSAIAVLKDRSGNVDSLVAGKDIFIMPNALQQLVQVEGDLVFAGYGLDIPGNYSDYAGLDVKGKIVVVLSGTPESLHLPSTINAHFSNVGSKATIAASKGAVGLVIAQAINLAAASNSVSVAMDPGKTKVYSRTSSGSIVVCRAPREVLHRLFMNSEKSLAQTLAALTQGKPSSFAFNSSVSIRYSNSFHDIESYNVIGRIDGGDSKLKTEYVVHTAHLDHLGVGKIVNGDSIYNGAHDNASGVASLLEIARTYKRMGSKPRRSVLIVMVTGEEMGLLGSAYFASNPTVPKAQIVADLNTDMPTVIFPLLSIAPLGANHSSLKNDVAFAAGELGIEVQEDPMPEENRFIRSDQYSFVLQGIPSLHVKYGIKAANPSIDLVKLTKEWRDKNYHKPSDEITNGFNYTAARKYAQLNFLIGYSVAQAMTRPTWNTGDFFDTRATK